MAGQSVELRSLVTPEGELRLSIEPVPIPELEADEVLVEVRATPINPSDQGLLTGAADLSAAQTMNDGGRATLVAPIPPVAMRWMAGRVGQSLPVGNEGAGVVVSAGASPEARALVGSTVAVWGGAMYATHRKMKAEACLRLPPNAKPADGASCFINPLTALGMVETMRAEGHTGLVHTAAASNLGQMLNRICLADGVPLVNIVRSAEQVDLLRSAAAGHVVDSSAADFTPSLVAALKATGATLGFDAIGGGRLASDILTAMEAVAAEGLAFNRYGSGSHKQVYIYGGLDLRPTELTRGFGFAWGLGGWLLTPFLQRAGEDTAARLRKRIVDELTTTFASHYTRTISLSDLLDPETLRQVTLKSTGRKYLVDPGLG